ncbi:MAG: HEPN domain-containing protein [Nitrospinae bacterium]|nr:HEPN domain-containing protein [Nitrospinota bacterium]
MNDEAKSLWNRALEDLVVAEENLGNNHPNAAASQAYYAAFNAVSAYFALDGKFFVSHTGVEHALHKDLIKNGMIDKEI